MRVESKTVRARPRIRILVSAGLFARPRGIAIRISDPADTILNGGGGDRSVMVPIGELVAALARIPFTLVRLTLQRLRDEAEIRIAALRTGRDRWSA